MPRRNITTDKDLGYKRILRDVEILAMKPFVKIGINEAEGSQPKEIRESGVPVKFKVIDVALVHEFGSRDGRIPQRSFVRRTHDSNLSQWTAISKRLKGEILSGKRSVSQALDLMGVKGQADMRRTIQKRIPPPLAASTLKQKTVGGRVGSTPLIDTGQLLGSIQYVKIMDGRNV